MAKTVTIPFFRALTDANQALEHIVRTVKSIERTGKDPKPAQEEAIARATKVVKRAFAAIEKAELSGLVKELANTKRATYAGQLTLAILYLCFRRGRRVPEAAIESFSRIYEGQGTLKSWDNAFGQPTSKHQRAKRQRETQSLGEIERRVMSAKKAHIPIDNDLFEKIGLDLGLGGSTTVKKLYSRLKHAKTRQ